MATKSGFPKRKGAQLVETPENDQHGQGEYCAIRCCSGFRCAAAAPHRRGCASAAAAAAAPGVRCAHGRWCAAVECSRAGVRRFVGRSPPIDFLAISRARCATFAAALNASLKATQQLEELDVHLESLIGNLVGQQVQLDDNDETIGRIQKKTHTNAELISKVEKDAHKLEKLSNCCTIA